MLAVLDTNVFIAALLHGPTVRRVYEAFLRGQFTPLFSRETLDELLAVLTRPALRVLTSEAEVAAFLELIRRDALMVKPLHHVTDCRDPKDNIFLDCALAGPADCVVTGDNDLLDLHPFHGIPILRPAEFLRRLSE